MVRFIGVKEDGPWVSNVPSLSRWPRKIRARNGANAQRPCARVSSAQSSLSLRPAGLASFQLQSTASLQYPGSGLEPAFGIHKAIHLAAA